MREPGEARPGHEELLAEREWVRGLARVLAADGASAEDLEQDTMVAALRSPPPGGGFPRAWLATVMRNLARRRHRDGDRVRRREEAAARPESGEGGADVVARAEAHGRVVEAVLSLDEPARTAILLRFYDGLPPREVARRTGVPVETARTRLKRALAELRERLGGARGREGLLPALLPLLRPGKGIGVGAAGGIAMGAAAKAGLAAGVLVVALGGIAVWRGAGSGDGALPPGKAPAAAPPSTPAAIPRDLVRAPAPSPVPPAPAPAHPAGSEAKEPASDDPGAAIVGEIEIRDGTTLARALEDVARAAGLGLEFATPELRSRCEATLLAPMRLRNIPLRDAVKMLLARAPSPDPPRAILGEARGERLRVSLGVPPPPPPPDPGKAEKEERSAEALRERLRTEKTAFVFDGQSLSEAFAYLSARHGINFVVDDRWVEERGPYTTVKLRMADVTLVEALDELIRLDPHLLWEVKGNVVLIRRK